MLHAQCFGLFGIAVAVALKEVHIRLDHLIILVVVMEIRIAQFVTRMFQIRLLCLTQSFRILFFFSLRLFKLCIIFLSFSSKLNIAK